MVAIQFIFTAKNASGGASYFPGASENVMDFEEIEVRSHYLIHSFALVNSFCDDGGGAKVL